MRRGPIPIALYLIPVAALLAVFPLVLHGCSCGHDFDFHLVSWMEVAAQFKAGNLHPAWAFSPAWNAGEPRFVFYPPLSWTLGALLGLLLPWTAVPIVYTWIALAAAGFGMYFLARTLDAGPFASLISALIYIANPYMLFTAYERTAYAELLAAAWIPLLLAGVLRKRVTPLGIAIPVALLWLTNAPAAVMGCYSLAVLALLRLCWLPLTSRKNFPDPLARALAAVAGKVVAGLVLGLGLAAFYVLPAAIERRWVQIAMANVEGMRIQDNFLFHHTADAAHDEVLHTASLIAAVLLAATTLVFVASLCRAASREKQPLAVTRALPMLILAFVIGLLLTPAGAVVWRFAPEMAFLQFPWRLTAILAAMLCAGIAMLLPRLNFNSVWSTVAAISLVPCLAWPLLGAFTQGCDDEDTVAARLAVFNHHMGSDPTDEYTTGQADNDALAHNNPPFWIADDGSAAAPTSGEQPGSAPMHFALQTSHDAALILNLREFPAWNVSINGKPAKERIDRADGLIALPIHAGRSQVDISYAITADREWGDGLSIVAAGAALMLLWPRRHREASRTGL